MGNPEADVARLDDYIETLKQNSRNNPNDPGQKSLRVALEDKEVLRLLKKKIRDPSARLEGWKCIGTVIGEIRGIYFFFESQPGYAWMNLDFLAVVDWVTEHVVRIVDPYVREE